MLNTPAGRLAWPGACASTGTFCYVNPAISGTSSGIAAGGGALVMCQRCFYAPASTGCGGNESAKCTAARAASAFIWRSHPSGMCQNPPFGAALLGLRCSPRQADRNDRARLPGCAQPGQARSDWPCPGRLPVLRVPPGRNEKLSRFLRTALRCHLACKLLVGSMASTTM